MDQAQGRAVLRSGLIDILKSLIRSPAVVGAEHSFFRVLQRELEERGAEVTWYEGLLVARSPSRDRRCCRRISTVTGWSAPGRTSFNMPLS